MNQLTPVVNAWNFMGDYHMQCLQRKTRDPQSEAWACIPLEVELEAAQMRLAIKAAIFPVQIVRVEAGSQKFEPGRWEIAGDESLDKDNGISIAISTLFWDLESKGWIISPCPTQSKFSQWIVEIVSPILANPITGYKWELIPTVEEDDEEFLNFCLSQN